MLPMREWVARDAARIGLEAARDGWANRLMEFMAEDPTLVSKISLKELANAFCADATNPMSRFNENTTMTTQFALLMQSIALQSTLGNPDRTSFLVADQLVTTLPSENEQETLYDLQALNDEDPEHSTPQGGEIPKINILGEKATRAPEPTKFSRILELTREDIFFDRLNAFRIKAQSLGDLADMERERRAIGAIEDSRSRFYPDNGRGQFSTQSMYRLIGAIDTKKWWKRHETTIVKPLVDDSDLDEVMQIFAGRTDENNRKINVTPTVALFPLAMKRTALRAFGISGFKLGADSDPSQVTGMLTTKQVIGADLQLVFSRHLTAAGTYYIGNPKRCFFEHLNWPKRVIQYTPKDSEDRDIAVAYKVEYKGDTNVGPEMAHSWLRCTAS